METSPIAAQNAYAPSAPPDNTTNSAAENDATIETAIKVVAIVLAIFAIATLFAFAPADAAFAFSAMIVVGMALLFVGCHCPENTVVIPINPSRVDAVIIQQTPPVAYIAAPTPVAYVTATSLLPPDQYDRRRTATRLIPQPAMDNPASFRTVPNLNIAPPPPPVSVHDLQRLSIPAPLTGGNVGFGSVTAQPSSTSIAPTYSAPTSGGNVGFGSATARPPR